MYKVPVLASTSAPFRPTTVQMPILALIKTKRITVHRWGNLWTIFMKFCKGQFFLWEAPNTVHIATVGLFWYWRLTRCNESSIFSFYFARTQYWGSVQWSPTIDMKLRYGYPSSWIWSWFQKRLLEKFWRDENYCTLYGNDEKIPSLLCL